MDTFAIILITALVTSVTTLVGKIVWEWLSGRRLNEQDTTLKATSIAWIFNPKDLLNIQQALELLLQVLKELQPKINEIHQISTARDDSLLPRIWFRKELVSQILEEIRKNDQH